MAESSWLRLLRLSYEYMIDTSFDYNVSSTHHHKCMIHNITWKLVIAFFYTRFAYSFSTELSPFMHKLDIGTLRACALWQITHVWLVYACDLGAHSIQACDLSCTLHTHTYAWGALQAIYEQYCSHLRVIGAMTSMHAESQKHASSLSCYSHHFMVSLSSIWLNHQQQTVCATAWTETQQLQSSESTPVWCPTFEIHKPTSVWEPFLLVPSAAPAPGSIPRLRFPLQ